MSLLDKVHIAITCTQRGWYDNTLGKKKYFKKKAQDLELENYMLPGFSYRVASKCIIKHKT